jgi:aryl-alcohol dehydrogenase-like predicted oxidoreductase
MTTLDGSPVSRFAFGTMQFGAGADETDSRAMFDACRAAGLNHFDTAYVYTDGASETLLGQMVGDERDALLIATKYGSVGGAGRTNMMQQFDVSCGRLGLDGVDLLYLHMFDPDTDLRETMEGFAALKQARRIRYVGLSNFAAWQVMKAVRVAAEFDLTVDILQPMYNLVKRQAEVEILPMCADQGIAVAPYSPLGGGLLTGKYARGDSGRLKVNDMYRSRYRQDWMHATAADLSALAQEVGTNPATLAVAWVAAHPSKPMPIISGRTADQLRPSLTALEFDMADALYDRISALSPTPAPATDRSEDTA